MKSAEMIKKNMKWFFFCLSFSIFLCSCGLEEILVFDEPKITYNNPLHSSNEYLRWYFSFETAELNQPDGFIGTEVYYKIYNNSSTLTSQVSSITAVNNSSNGSAAATRMIETYGYQTLGTNPPLKSSLFLPAAGYNRKVIMRLKDYTGASTETTGDAYQFSACISIGDVYQFSSGSYGYYVAGKKWYNANRYYYSKPTGLFYYLFNDYDGISSPDNNPTENFSYWLNYYTSDAHYGEVTAVYDPATEAYKNKTRSELATLYILNNLTFTVAGVAGKSYERISGTTVYGIQMDIEKIGFSSVNGTSLMVPYRNGNNKSFDFFDDDDDDENDKRDVKPAEGDSDYCHTSGSTDADTYYVQMFAVGIAWDSNNCTKSYSLVLDLGSVPIKKGN